MATFIYPSQSVTIPGVATEATLLQVEQNTADTVNELQDVNSELNTQTTELQDINTELNTQTAELQNMNTELDSQTIYLQGIDSELNTHTTLLSAINTELDTQTNELQLINIELQDVNTELNTQTGLLTQISDNQFLNIVDQLDTPLLDTSSTNIPASSSLPVEVVSSLAADVKKIIVVDDIGEFIGIYTGPASSEVLKAIMPLGGGEVELEINSGTRISLRHMKNTTINSGFIAINFLG